jgi:hypothetical protein
MNNYTKIAAKVGLLSTLVLACDDSHSVSTPEPSGSEGAVYALQTFVYQPDETVMSYIALTDSLDVDGELSLGEAREFPGYAFISDVGGKLLLSTDETPAIVQYEISDDFDWHETGSVSFINQGLPSYGAGFERHWFLNEHVAYLTLEVTGRIVWDPTRMRIVEVMEDTELELERDGLVLDATFNRPPLLLEGPVLKPFYYRDQDWFLFGPTTPIAVYDPETHEEQEIIEASCPAVEVMSQDEQGNTYFSPWSYGPTLSLFGEGPTPCIARVRPDLTVETLDLSEWTEQRPVHVFRYVADGKAIGTVLHTDEIEGDFESGYNEDLALELDAHWRLWYFDLDTETAHPIEEIGASGSGFSMAEIDGRNFLFVPNEEWSETMVYEIDDQGTAEVRFVAPGVVNNWIKIR